MIIRSQLDHKPQLKELTKDTIEDGHNPQLEELTKDTIDDDHKPQLKELTKNTIENCLMTILEHSYNFILKRHKMI
jgi:hypothetical protein